jgi:hypothetical protein
MSTAVEKPARQAVGRAAAIGVDSRDGDVIHDPDNSVMAENGSAAIVENGPMFRVASTVSVTDLVARVVRASGSWSR